MLANLDKNNNYKYEFEIFTLFENCYFITFNSSTSYIDIIKQANTYLQKNRTGFVFLVCYINEFFNYKKNEATKLKSYVKLAAQKGYNINLLKIGNPLEDPQNVLNKKIQQINNYKKTTFSTQNHKYFFISNQDLKNAVQNILSTGSKGGIFNITLNYVSENKILTLFEKHIKFKKQIIKTNENVNKVYKLNFSPNLKIGFKPTVTINNYIKNNVFSSNKRSVNKKFILKKINFKLFLQLALTATITWGIFLVADFALDNFSLYKSIKNENLQNTLFYSNKLKNRYLPTKWGSNYTALYSSVYYGATAANIFIDQTQNKKPVNEQTANEIVGKAISFFRSVDPNLLITKQEKQLYQSISPLATALNYNSNYSGLFKTADIISKGVTLVVLIQNSNEIRPTGGFVGSYALLNTKDFKINSIKFDDIYNIDGTLENKYKDILIKTPDEYKGYLNTEYLYARDLNLLLNSYDRNTNYIRYFETALNTKIDGVVYINTQTIKKLIQITGPIYLASYNETVTAENFDTLAQTYSEKNYYPGSSQKQEFLTLLGGKVIDKIKESNYVNSKNLYTLAQAIVSNDLELYFKNNEYNNSLYKTGLSSKIETSQNQEIFYLIENNLGENKVNKLAEKQVELKIEYDVRRGIKTTTVTTNIKNLSTTYNFPYGDYRGLLQVYAPLNLIITQTKEIFKDSEVDISNKKSAIIDENNLIINIPFAVKPNEESKTTLSYEEQIENYDKKQNKLLIIKQPGAKPYTLKITFDIPNIKSFKKELLVDKNTEINLY